MIKDMVWQKLEKVKDRSDSSPCLKDTVGRIFSVLHFPRVC